MKLGNISWPCADFCSRKSNFLFLFLRFSQPTSGPYLFPSWCSLPFTMSLSIGVFLLRLLKQPSWTKGVAPNCYGWLIDMFYAELTQVKRWQWYDWLGNHTVTAFLLYWSSNNPIALILFFTADQKEKKKKFYGSPKWLIIKDIVVCKLPVSLKKTLSLYMSFTLIKACWQPVIKRI